MKRTVIILMTFALSFGAFSQTFYRNVEIKANLEVEEDATFQGPTNMDGVVNFSGDSMEINGKVTIVDDSIDIHTDTACCGFVGLRVRLAGGNTAYGYYNTALARAASVVQKGQGFYGTYYLLAFKLARLESDSIAEVKAPDVRFRSSDSLFFMNLPIDTVGLPLYRLYRDSLGRVYQKRF